VGQFDFQAVTQVTDITRSFVWHLRPLYPVIAPGGPCAWSQSTVNELPVKTPAMIR
jgi:hypothetical protein